MRLVLHRVRRAEICPPEPGAEAAIGEGVLILVGFEQGDDEAVVDRLAGKAARLRLFPEGERRLSRSLLDTGGEVLVGCQMALAADTSRGSKPNLSRTAAPVQAAELYEAFGRALRRVGVAVVRRIPFASSLELEVRHWGPLAMTLEA